MKESFFVFLYATGIPNISSSLESNLTHLFTYDDILSLKDRAELESNAFFSYDISRYHTNFDPDLSTHWMNSINSGIRPHQP